MSRGIGAWAEKSFEDEDTLIYKYGAYNLNDEKYKNEALIKDGQIVIDKKCFAVIDDHADVEVISLSKAGLIKVSNCGCCWKTTEDGIDIMAWHILIKMFNQYRKDGEIPGRVSYNV